MTPSYVSMVSNFLLLSLIFSDNILAYLSPVPASKLTALKKAHFVSKEEVSADPGTIIPSLSELQKPVKGKAWIVSASLAPKSPLISLLKVSAIIILELIICRKN